MIGVIHQQSILGLWGVNGMGRMGIRAPKASVKWVFGVLGASDGGISM